MAVYLARGSSSARAVATVLVVLNIIGGFGYLFQGYLLRASLTIPLEVLVLWLMYNARSSDFINVRSRGVSGVSPEQPGREVGPGAVTFPAAGATLSP